MCFCFGGGKQYGHCHHVIFVVFVLSPSMSLCFHCCCWYLDPKLKVVGLNMETHAMNVVWLWCTQCHAAPQYNKNTYNSCSQCVVSVEI